MSIESRWLQPMDEGRKRFELRKSRPIRALPPFRVLLVETGSGGQIVAQFTCDSITDMTEWPDFDVARLAAIDLTELQAYRRRGGRLQGWRVKDFQRIDGGTIGQYGLKCPPQSWCYIESEILASIKGVERKR